jgi:hypothetical protein
MKIVHVSCLILLMSPQLFAQNTLTLDANNANVMLGDFGAFCFNPTGSAGYEIPKNSGNHTLYNMQFRIAGKDGLGNVKTAFSNTYATTDFSAGPISNNYSSGYYTNTFDTCIWKVTRDQINYHVANYTAVGYIVDASIAKWPGNGNTAEGVAAQLAPYVDANGDQLYNPLDGDYPYIQGDAATFVIMNDAGAPHQLTLGSALGVEIHFMFYQFETTDEINNTTFLSTKIFNRSDTNYTDLYFGFYLDFDLGNSNNDYVGSDSIRSLAYVYNGESTDDGQGAQPGYGNNPPAFGFKMLNEEAGSIYGYDGGSIGLPGVLDMDDNYMGMQGLLANGDPLMYAPYPTKFVFTGNPFLGTGWNEFTAGNSDGDRRMFISSESYNLQSADNLCFDYAFIFNQEAGNALGNANSLLSTADFVQNYYDNAIYPCNEIFLETIDQNTPMEISIFPNPSNGNFKIQISKPVLISIYSITGDLVMQEFELTESRDLNLNLERGIYFVQIKSGDETRTQKIIIH